jgi:pyridoxine 4-dehydrogenase
MLNLNADNTSYSPLGRGMLTGQIKSPEDLPDDFRRHMPRFSKEAFPLNLQLVDEVKKVATEKGCSPGQIAIAWVRQEGNAKATVIPIPGASTSNQVAENVQEVTLNKKDMDDIDAILAKFPVAGDRYGGPAAAHIWG